MTTETELLSVLTRIAAALERAVPAAPVQADFAGADAFVWSAEGAGRFHPVGKVNRVPLDLLKGIDHTASILLENTRRFAAGLPANNALLWGARGMGKSALLRSAVASAQLMHRDALALVQVSQDALAGLTQLFALLGGHERRFLVFIDDLGFEDEDGSGPRQHQCQLGGQLRRIGCQW